MSFIQIHDLTFAYEGSCQNIFEHVELQLDTDWKLGLIGRNGRGKTTLLQLFMGRFPFQGSITADAEFEYFPYPVEHPEHDVLDVIRAVAPQAEDWQIMRELSLLSVPDDALYRSFSLLSQGEQTKVLLCALFLKENRFLLIDEPTNHLDADARRVMAGYLKCKRGFLLVSHDRAFLDRCVDHILVLNRTGIELQRGNFSSWWENRQRQDAFEQAEQEKLKRDIARLNQAAKQNAGWSDQAEKAKYNTKNSGLRPDRGYVGHKAAKMMKRSKAIQNRTSELAAEKSKLLKNLETAERLSISPLPFHSSRLLEILDLSISYQGISICRDIRFTIDQGERVALTGKNGSGKSSLLKLICGEPVPYTGTLRKNGQLIISYVSQSTDGLRGSLYEYAKQTGVEESLLKSILRKLGFERAQFDTQIEQFSEGQKKKVMLARSLCQRAHLYLWDEPLNFIDVISRLQIETLLMEFRPTLLFVEHDLAFTEKISTKTVEFHRASS